MSAGVDAAGWDLRHDQVRPLTDSGSSTRPPAAVTGPGQLGPADFNFKNGLSTNLQLDAARTAVNAVASGNRASG